MSKIGRDQPVAGKYRDYLSHPFYEEKVQTVQEQVYRKLKKVAEFLESLYPKLTDAFSGNIKVVIEKSVKILIHDLDLMQQSWQKDPFAFNTIKLKTNQHCITEMKNICDTLQTVKSYEYEFRKLSKIKHVLHELEHLIQPTSFEKSLQKAQLGNQVKTIPIKQERTPIDTKKKINEKSIGPKKKKPISKKAKPATKTTKSAIKAKKTTAKPKLSKSAQKSKTAAPKRKQVTKKVLKTKSLTKPKKTLAASSKKTMRTSGRKTTTKARVSPKPKKTLAAKSKPKTK